MKMKNSIPTAVARGSTGGGNDSPDPTIEGKSTASKGGTVGTGNNSQQGPTFTCLSVLTAPAEQIINRYICPRMI